MIYLHYSQGSEWLNETQIAITKNIGLTESESNSR